MAWARRVCSLPHLSFFLLVFTIIFSFPIIIILHLQSLAKVSSMLLLCILKMRKLHVGTTVSAWSQSSLRFLVMRRRESHFLLSLSAPYFGCQQHQYKTWGCSHTPKASLHILWHECYCTAMKSLTSTKLKYGETWWLSSQLQTASWFRLQVWSLTWLQVLMIISSLLFLSLSYIHWNQI